MIHKITRYAFTIITIAILFVLSSANALSNSNKIKVDSLSDRYKDLFHLGAAINQDVILGKDIQSENIITSEFNSITP